MFFALFGAVALVGAVGAASMQVLKGPVRAMAEVTKRTVAENNMIASTKLAIIGSANQTNADCNADGFIEPIEPEDAGAGPKPAGGGYLPASIGAALNDPWDTRFGYCAFDHGSAVAKCAGAKPLLQTGGPIDNQYAIAVISAGADRIFQTACNAYVDTTPADDIPDTPLLVKTPGTDDIVLGYTYAEANNIGGGLWTLKDGDNSKATLSKDIEVRNAADTDTVFALDRTTGMAEFMAIKTDNLYSKTTPNGTIQVQDLFRVKGYEDLDAPSGGGGGGAADNLGNHIATMNLKIFHTAGGAGISGSETDPQVGTLTNTKWCATDGTDIDCTQNAPLMSYTETDPKVGTLTNTKWCTTDGTAINCTSDAPSGGGSPSGMVSLFNLDACPSGWTASPVAPTASGKTKLLVHANGTNGSTSFTDSSPNGLTLTTYGNAQVSTAQSKFGGASAVFDGTGDYISDGMSNVFAFGTGDYTFDFWIRWNGSVPATKTLIGCQNNGVGANWGLMAWSGSKILVMDTGAPAAQAFVSATTFSPNTWYHLAVVRTANVIKLYVNGVADANSYTGTTNLAQNYNFTIGADAVGNIGFNGWIDEVRVTKGQALWTSNFTPPAAATTGYVGCVMN